MEANEIMTGDYFRIKETGKVIQITVVDASYETVDYFDADAEGELTIEIRKIEPIPLTAEILEKNGFVGDKQVMQYHFTEDGQKYHFSLRQMYDMDNNPKGYSFFAFNVLTIIDYVHQLQHALGLCDVEKEIVL